MGNIPAFQKEIKKKIRRGERAFLIGKINDRKLSIALPRTVAALKMAQLDVDFHFC